MCFPYCNALYSLYLSSRVSMSLNIFPVFYANKHIYCSRVYEISKKHSIRRDCVRMQIWVCINIWPNTEDIMGAQAHTCI